MSGAFGARVKTGGVLFRLWAPLARQVEVVLEHDDRGPLPLAPEGGGVFTLDVPALDAGALYRFRVDGRGPFPDPASRFQPTGVHGASEVVDPTRFAWTDAGWGGVPLEDAVLYELHVGTFSPEGTFAGASDKLTALKDLGVTVVELMPVADFAGERNWGYDGVALFAPARCYGRPDDLRALVDRAHGLGLAVILDVVYNHLGPDGAYLGAISPPFFSPRHHTPWGDAVNLDGEHSATVRRFLTENATRWIAEYHLDGLRLDATHALHDTSPRHVLAEIAAAARAAAPGRRILVIAEDHRNLAEIVRPEPQGGMGLDAVWADDLHHEIRRALAGDHEGYFGDFCGTTEEIAATLEQGWLYCGQNAPFFGGPRGTDPTGVPLRRRVVCLQNHDQVGNRALGERLHHSIDLAAYHAACALVLLAPETPLLFMGQEWAASTPFLYFTDHHPELGRLVTQGRRREFASFSAFRDPKTRERIPDPQAPSTFLMSRLRWEERDTEPHGSTLRLHRELLRLRRTLPREEDGFRAFALGEDTVGMWRGADEDEDAVLVIARLRGSGEVRIGGDQVPPSDRSWTVALDTEAVARPGHAIPVDLAPSEIRVVFARPGALVLRG